MQSAIETCVRQVRRAFGRLFAAVLLVSGAGTASAGTPLLCAFGVQPVVFNEFYTGSGSFVEIYFLQSATITNWGIYQVRSSGTNFDLVATLGTGAGTVSEPDGAGGYTTKTDSANGGTFPAGTFITYAVGAPDSKAEFLLANTATKASVAAGAAVVVDYFYYTTPSDKTDPYFNVNSSCGAYITDHSNSQKDIYRATDGSGGWLDGNSPTKGVSNNPGGGANHIRIEHDGSGLTCEAETITLKACADALCTTLYTAAPVSVALTPTSGLTWSANPVTFTGQTTVTVASSNEQSLTLGTGAVSPASATATQCRNTADSSGSCTFAFVDAEFKVATVPAQSAGVTSGTLTISAVEKNTATGTCKGKFNGNISVELAARCLDPLACAGKSLFVNGSAVGTVSTGAALSYSTQTMNFSGASSTTNYSLRYDDVGKMTFYIRYGLGGGRYMNGESNAFVVKPFAFAVGDIKRTADGAAAPAPCSGAGCAKFVTAGSGVDPANAFTVTVTSVAQGGTATPNFGKEVVQEGIKLTPVRIADPDLVADGKLYVDNAEGGLIAQLNLFAGGAATKATLAWSEVGVVTLVPSVGDGDYLGAGDVVSAPSANVGRFYPAAYELASASLTPGCAADGFTYMGQPFTLGAILEARNSLGSVTRNYHGAYAKGAVALGAENQDNGIDLGSRLAVAAAWNQGRYDASAVSATFSRPITSTPDATWGPYDTTQFGIRVSDADGPLLASLDMNPATVGVCAPGCTHRRIGAPTPLRFGRLRLLNAYGSSNLPLAVPYQLRYWQGAGFAANGLDATCTVVPVGAVALGNHQGLAATDVAPVTVVKGSAGGDIVLKAPGKAGTVDVAVDLGASAAALASCAVSSPSPALTAGADREFLRYRWCGTALDKDPAARASFGLYKGSRRLIYRREVR